MHDLIIIEDIQNLPAFTKEDVNFLSLHKEHLNNVLVKTHIWRTDIQKKSIINDVHFPTTHAKFHQSILEQKVQFENALYLAKDYELKKVEIDLLLCDLEDLTDSKRDQIIKRKLEIELQFKRFELKQMQTSMHYRMEEIKGWQKIINELYDEMITQGIDDATIWNKNEGELSSLFFIALNNAQALDKTTDSAERGNIIGLLSFVIAQTKSIGIYDKLKAYCNNGQLEILKKFNQ